MVQKTYLSMLETKDNNNFSFYSFIALYNSLLSELVKTFLNLYILFVFFNHILLHSLNFVTFKLKSCYKFMY